MKVPHHAEVIIVGGGIAGTSLLYELAARGVEALLIERGPGPSGASTIPAALLNPHRGRTARARQLDRDGLEAYWRLSERLAEGGFDHGSHRSGVLRAASNRRQATAWQRLAAGTASVSTMASAHVTAEAAPTTGLTWLETHEFPAPYHAPFGGLLVPEGGWVEPAKLLAGLTAAAVDLGSRSLTGLRYTGWRPAPGGGVAVEVVSERGAQERGAQERGAPGRRAPGRGAREFLAAELVLCLGAYEADSCRLPRLALAPGVAATFALPTLSIGHVPPLAGAVGIVFREQEVVLSGGVLSPLGAEVENGELAEAAELTRQTAGWSLPLLRHAQLGSIWHGTRARRPSGNPVLRRLAPGVTLFAGLAGRGFLAGPLLAARLAGSLAIGLASRPTSPTDA